MEIIETIKPAIRYCGNVLTEFIGKNIISKKHNYRFMLSCNIVIDFKI